MREMHLGDRAARSAIGEPNEGTLWQSRVATAPETEYPRLRGRRDFDIAIVGAGMTAALELAQAGRKVAVLEARRIGRQVTGRSTAKITTQHGLIYRYLIDTHGIEKTKLYADANEAGLRYIERLVAEGNIECDCEQRVAFVYVRPNSRRRHELDAEAEAARSLGLDADVLATAPLPFQPEAPCDFRAKHNSTRPNI